MSRSVMVKTRKELLEEENVNEILRDLMTSNFDEDGQLVRYDTEGHDPDMAKPELFQWIQDAGKEVFNTFGNNPTSLKDFTVYKVGKPYDWDKIVPDHLLGNDYWANLGQAIMERQEEYYSTDNLYIWINENFRKVTGPLFDESHVVHDMDHGDWEISDDQEKKIDQICMNARAWYQSLPLKRR